MARRAGLIARINSRAIDLEGGISWQEGVCHQQTNTCRSHIRVASTLQTTSQHRTTGPEDQGRLSPGWGSCSHLCIHTCVSLISCRLSPSYKTATSHSMREGVKRERGRGGMGGEGPARSWNVLGPAVDTATVRLGRPLVARNLRALECTADATYPATHRGRVGGQATAAAAAPPRHTQDKPMSTGDADLSGHFPRERHPEHRK